MLTAMRNTATRPKRITEIVPLESILPPGACQVCARWNPTTKKDTTT